MNLIRKIYEPKQVKIGKLKKADLVVPLDYGNLEGDAIIPDAEVKCITRAAELIRDGLAEHLAWASTSSLSVSPYTLNLKKLELAKCLGIDPDQVTTVEATNTITEAEDVLKASPGVKSIIIVCDWRHAPRTLMIWKHFFKGRIAVITIDGDWNEHHASRWCRSNAMFLAANLGHHAILKVVGVERLRKVTHKPAH